MLENFRDSDAILVAVFAAIVFFFWLKNRHDSLKEEQKWSITKSSEDAATEQVFDDDEARSAPDTYILEPDADVLSPIIKRFVRTAVVYPRDVPPKHPINGSSFFGGVPIGPNDFVWPRLKETDVPLTFMGQIDLAQMPKCDATSDFPADGVLYFFVGCPDGASWGRKNQQQHVVYMAKSPEEWAEIAPPDNLPETQSESYGWIVDSGNRPKTFVKSVVTPACISEHPSSIYAITDPAFFNYDDYDEIDEVWAQEANRLNSDDWDAAFGPRASYEKTVVAEFDWSQPTAIAAMPPIWQAVQMLCIGVAASLEDFMTHRDDLTPEAIGQLRQMAHDVSVLEKEADLHSPFDIMSPDTEKRFRGFLSDASKYQYDPAYQRMGEDGKPKRGFPLGLTLQISRNWNDALDKCIEACLNYSATTAALISDNHIKHVNHRVGHRRHQTGGYPSSVQTAGEDYAPYYFLLMQFGYDRGQQWQFGDGGVFQYWIKQKDLREQRWENVILTFEAH